MPRFTVIATGTPLPGFDREQVVRNLAALFKGRAPAAKLLTGQSVVVKTVLDAADARRYQRALTAAGACCEIRPGIPPDTSPAAASPPAGTQPPKRLRCPHCGFDQPENEACARCGIIFAKYQVCSPRAGTTSSRPAAAPPPPRRRLPPGFWRAVRITALLTVLAVVAGHSWLAKARSTDWDAPLTVGIYPVNADDSDAAGRFIQNLDPASFSPITAFMQQEARRYELLLEDPFRIRLAPEVRTLPPAAPAGRSPLAVIWWSLQLRYWAWRADTLTEDPPDIRIFVLYHEARSGRRLRDSLGLQKGLLGVVYARASADNTARDNVVIAHELLHTVGATDKYDPASGLPLFPLGFARPDQDPLYPQQAAEIMAGRIPIAARETRMPPSLQYTLIGPQTAAEIRWRP
ncbi:MAG: hypothetical protein LJE63_12375 [Desulfobacteraceae bacterium]|nr:hypothetical protein [Desulfobacteraceae bacterium]